MKKNKYLIITSGGDAPGMNKIVYELYKNLNNDKSDCLLIKNGLLGLYKFDLINIEIEQFYNLSFQTSTIIGSSRFTDFLNLKNQGIIINNLKNNKVDKLIIIGGNGSFEAAKILSKHISVIFIPSTIDNDFKDSHLTLGFYSSLEYITKSIFNISLLSKNMNNSNLIEIMGNKSNSLINKVKEVFPDFIYIKRLEDINDSFFNEVINFFNKNKYLMIVIKEKILNNEQQEELITKIENKTNQKIRKNILGYLQRVPEINIVDLLFASNVAKYIIENIDQINNLIVSFNKEIVIEKI